MLMFYEKFLRDVQKSLQIVKPYKAMVNGEIFSFTDAAMDKSFHSLWCIGEQDWFYPIKQDSRFFLT